MPEAKQVLIADDSISGRDLLRVILECSGHLVIEARDGAEALLQAERCRPDLFILDLNMPRVDGYSVACELRKSLLHRETPILALSAGLSQEDADRLKQAGFSMCLTKPISPAKLKTCINEILGKL